MLPRHETDGTLPAGIHDATWAEFVNRFGVNPRRMVLLTTLRVVLDHIAAAGCAEVLIGGSFVTTKAQPGDVDLLWDVQTVTSLDLLHPMFRGPAGIEEIWARFGCHLFPTYLREERSGLPFPEFFQQGKDGQRVGIVRIDLTDWTPEEES
jgi:hypothetical protein